MRLSHAVVVLLLVPALALARDEPKKEKAEEPEGFLEVNRVFFLSVNDHFVGFNEGRRYDISINKLLPNAKAARAKLAKALKEQKNLDQTVFDWFGDDQLKRLNIGIGSKVPVQIAQAVIATYAMEAKLPVHIFLVCEDHDLAKTYRVGVGGYVDTGRDAMNPEQLRELVKPGLSQERFAEMLTKNGK